MNLITLLVGVPGSGKSTYINHCIDENERGRGAWIDGGASAVQVCSADHWFMRSGEYRFNPAELGVAHGKCLRKFVECLQSRAADWLVLDNTNTTTNELAPYVALAQAYDVKYEIVHLECPVEVAASRNVHGVPLKSIERMDENIKRMLAHFPPYWNKPIIVPFSSFGQVE